MELSSRPRIGLVSIALEANTFNPKLTELDDFRAVHLYVGDEVGRLRDSHHEVGGFLVELEEQGFQAVPLLAASAGPGGRLSTSVWRALIALLDNELRRVDPSSLDGLLIAPHGAMAAEHVDDADGEWMMKLREVVGEKIPIIATCDPHANVSQKMIDATDAILAYQTNPHLDQRAKGRKAAQMMVKTIRGEVWPVQSICLTPFAMGIERQSTDESPCSTLIQAARFAGEKSGILSASIIFGFPYADVPEMGSSAIVVANRDRGLATAEAERLGSMMFGMRRRLTGNLISVEEAVNEASNEDGPTCLLDMGDNVGGGAPGDNTSILQEILRQKAGPALAVIHDPESASKAIQAGIGRSCEMCVGGQSSGSSAIEGTFRVIGLSDGVFHEPEIRHGGLTHYDQGPTAIVQIDHVTIMLTTRRMVPFSLHQILHADLDPSQFSIIVAKGVHAPAAAYRPVCPRLIRVDSPGITSANMLRFKFNRRRRPMFPFEDI